MLTIPIEKISLYLLNLNHRDGAPKAKFFISVGFSVQNIDIFQKSLLNHPKTAQLKKKTPHPDGEKLVYECDLSTPNGNYCIRSVWVVDKKSTETRLITAYPFQ